MANFITKGPTDILNDMLRTYKAGMAELGYTVSIDPGTDTYILYTAIANELAFAQQQTVLTGDAVMPDTAVGADLDRVMNNFGMERRQASKGSGQITLESSADTLVPTGSQLVGSTGLIYEVVVGGTYSNGDIIDINSVSTGSAVNLEEGNTLDWLSTPPFAKSTVTIYSAVTGAVDDETDDDARKRLLSRLQNPPADSNYEQVMELAEELNPIVQKAFVYPAGLGPGTMMVTLAGYATNTSSTRAISAANMVGLSASIVKQIPSHTYTVVNTPTDITHDVSFRLDVPYPSGSFSSTTGAGWMDYQPFPMVDGSAIYYVSVEATSSTNLIIFVNDEAPIPEAGVTKISWINSKFQVKTATILSYEYDGGAQTYTVTLDKPFVGIANSDFVFPALHNAQTYVDAIVKSFSKFGPGEICNVAALLPTAYRQPRPNTGYPYAVDSYLLKDIINSSEEVLNCDYYYREYGAAGPSEPEVVGDPPNIYIPKRIAFYPPAT